MTHVSGYKARRDDFETSMTKLVSALLAVAEDVIAEEPRAEEEKAQGFAAAPAVPLVARSKTPQPGGDGRLTGLDGSGKPAGTKRESA